MEIFTIILTCLGSSGFFALVQFLLQRIFTKQDKKDEVSKSLKRLSERADEGDLNDSKTHLLILINHFPHDHKAILQEAEHYFLELRGDSWMAGIFVEWAQAENVNIDYIIRAHDQNLAHQLSKA